MTDAERQEDTLALEALYLPEAEDEDDDDDDDDNDGGRSSSESDRFSSLNDVDNSSSHGATTTTDVSGARDLGQRESHMISIIRVLVITTLFTLAAIVSNITFILVLHSQEHQFSKKLNIYANDIIRNYVDHLETQYWLADGLSNDFTAYATTGNSDGTTPSWPFVTLPNCT